MKKYFLVFILLCMALDLYAENLKYCNKFNVWKHRVYNEDGKFSSSKILETIRDGYCGMEFDIIYDKALDMMYVAHNSIKSTEEKNYRSIDKLDTLLLNYKGYIWLDWKLTEIQFLNRGLELIETKLKKYLSNKDVIIYIETPNLMHNEFLQLVNSNEQIKILNWIDLEGKGWEIVNSLRWAKAFLYKCILNNRLISTSSIDLINICNARNDKNIFLFTINDFETVQKAFTNGYTVILTDNIKPKDFKIHTIKIIKN